MVSFQQLKFVLLFGAVTAAPAMLRSAVTPFPTGFVHPQPSPTLEAAASTITTAVVTASAKVTDAVTHIATTAPKELAATFNALRDSMYDLFVKTTGCLDNMDLRVQGTSSWMPKLLTPCAEQQATSFRALAADTMTTGDSCTSGAYSALAEGISQANTYVQNAITGPSSIWASNPCLRNPDCVTKLFDTAATTTPEGNAARDFLKTAFNELVRIKATLADKLYADYQTRSCANGYLARINTVSQEKLSEVQAFLNPEYVCESVCSTTRSAASWIAATCSSIGAYLATVDATTWKVVGTVAALYVTVKYGPRWCRSLWARLGHA
jgi:hypothetical protein